MTRIEDLVGRVFGNNENNSEKEGSVEEEEEQEQQAPSEFGNDKCMNVCFCDQCCWNGYVDEKVVYEFEGLRSETEDGFIYIYEVYDYPIKGEKTKHEHKYNQRLIDELVAVSLCKEMEARA